MKNLILLVTLLFSVSAMAEMPKYLEGATVTVTLKNGKTYEYKSEEMAVVTRKHMQVPIAKEIIKALKEEKIVPNKKTRVYLLGGVGNTGDLESSTNGSRYQVEHERGFVGGIGVQQKVNQDINIGIQVQTNGTTSLSVGKDF